MTDISSFEGSHKQVDTASPNDDNGQVRRDAAFLDTVIHNVKVITDIIRTQPSTTILEDRLMPIFHIVNPNVADWQSLSWPRGSIF